MTDREFKQLKRSELIDIIYEYQKHEEELNKEIERLNEQLNDRNLKAIEDARVIADVVQNLGIIVDTTQKLADNYLATVSEKMK